MKTSDLAITAAYFHDESLVRSAERLMAMGCKRLEFEGLALKALPVSTFKELGLILAGEGAACSAVNVVGDLMPVSLGNLAAINQRERRQAIDHVKACVDLAAGLNGRRIVCDLGTSTEDLVSFDEQNEHFSRALEEILSSAEYSGVTIVLLSVPGRRWFAWDGLPPDPMRVVERHVWPWRMWFDAEKLLADIARRFTTRVRWAFDCANEVVAHGSTKFRLEDAVAPYVERGLETVYLANHPGLYNHVWHRSLLHQPIWDGFFAVQDYSSLFEFLSKHHFGGEVCVNVREKNPSESLLRRSLKVIENGLHH